MKKKTLFFIILLLCIVIPVFIYFIVIYPNAATAARVQGQEIKEDDWEYIGSSKNGDSWYFIPRTMKTETIGENLNSYEPRRKCIKVWIVCVYLKIEDEVKSVKTLYYLDCNREKMSIRYNTTYDAEGNVVNSYNNTLFEYDSNFEEAIPGSMGEAILNTICNYNSKK